MSSWGVSYISIADRINEIRKSAETGYYQSALALALTLPDICGQIEYPDFIRNNSKNRDIGRQYATWFDEYVGMYYRNDKGGLYFSGTMCYKLRCAYLHSGDAAIGDFDVPIPKINEDEMETNCCFELSCDSERYGKIENANNKKQQLVLRINVVNLCNFLCNAAEHYYNSYANKDAFKEHSYNFICIADFANEARK